MYTSQDWLEEIENKYFDEHDDLVRQSKCWKRMLEMIKICSTNMLHFLILSVL